MPRMKSSPVITRCPSNPILRAPDIPYHATTIFNAGVTKFRGRYVMVFRNDYGRAGDPKFDGTNLGVAFSDDGIRWTPREKPWFALETDEVKRAYDPRLTVIDGRCYMCLAVDTHHGIRGGIAVTEDFDNYEILSLSVPDNRNMVLFPERINGRFARLERPMPVYSRGNKDRFDTWFSDSPDLKYWGNSQLVLGVEQVPFANDKIGPAAPPVKTKRGWLTTFHAVDRDDSRGKNGWAEKWTKRYTAGIMLLDLHEPWRVIGLSRAPLLVPEAPYEVEGGFRNHVIFPGGMILEDSGEVKIYYGSADTVECLATAHVDDLLSLCEPVT
jgi:beta-1,4-mannooligosaccharide/beta-1,4-mannosyl-N-acetylglucosamine phosphorylase